MPRRGRAADNFGPMPAVPALNPVNVMTTDEVAVRDRVPFWQDWVRRVFCGLDTDVYGDPVIDAQLRSAQAGSVVLTRLEAGRHRVMRDARIVRTNDSGYLKIVAPQKGRAGVVQNGRTAWVGPGEWSIYDTTDTYAVENPERVEHLIVMLPKAELAERGLPLPELMARPLNGKAGVGRLALEAMRSAYQELPNLTPDTARGVGESITQLVHLALLDLAGRGTAVSQREALRDRIKQIVARRLGDPRLGVDDIAGALQCSRRQLYNAFADEEEGVAGYLLRERLEAVRRDLADPTQVNRSITDIAMDRGFNSLAHFSRVFAQRYGVPPSVYRRLGYGQTVIVR